MAALCDSTRSSMPSLWASSWRTPAAWRAESVGRREFVSEDLSSNDHPHYVLPAFGSRRV